MNSKIVYEIFSPRILYPEIQEISHNFNFRKAFLKRGYTKDSNSINIELSSDDIVSFQEFYQSSITEEGYLVDEINFWRKAEVHLGLLEKQKVRIKIHGTSPTPILRSISIPNKIQSIFRELNNNDFDVSRGGFSFKIKINSEGEFYHGKRRINLLSPYDDWNIVQNSLNKYINQLGVITTYGDIKKVYINGQEVGPYLAIESINKELLERNYNITNFAILNTNDDWNKGYETAHISTTDYSPHDIEQSGVIPTVHIAQHKFGLLMDAVYSNDVDLILELVDIDNLAKIAALINLTGTVHPILGDNTRYIYDFASGRFQLDYRLEGGVFNLQSNNPASFENKIFQGGNLHKILSNLLENQWFKDKRNKYLKKIVDDKDTIFNLMTKDFEVYYKILQDSDFPTIKYKHSYDIFINRLKANIKTIESFLGYSKIYSTVKHKKNNYLLEVLHDSYTSSYIESVVSCDNAEHVFNEPVFLVPGKYNPNSNGYINHIDSSLEIDIPFECIKFLNAFKEFDNKKIDQKHIYINYSKPFEFIDVSGLDQFDNRLQILNKTDGSQTYEIMAGNYEINEDVIFPNNTDLLIKPGTNIYLDENVSILVRGNLFAEGTSDKKILISSTSNNASSFGTFAVIGSFDKPSIVRLNFFSISGGSEKVINGTYFSSQLSIHHSNTIINNSLVKNSTSDDGLNIKFSDVVIKNSTFANNYADQIDLDYAKGEVINNLFYYDAKNKDVITDGLDISGSRIVIRNNSFSNMTDKGISVGESSNALIEKNTFNENTNAIAIKDNSIACINNNSYENNFYDLNSYIKKKMYLKPKIFFDEVGLNINKEFEESYEIYPYLNQDCLDWLSVEKIELR